MNMSQYAQMIRQLKTPEVMKRLNTLYGQREGMMVAQTTRYTALLKRHEDLFNTSRTHGDFRQPYRPQPRQGVDSRRQFGYRCRRFSP